MNRKLVRIGVGIGAVTLVVGTAIAVIRLQSAESSTVKTEFDMNSAEFYLAKDGLPGKKVQLDRGKYFPKGSESKDPHMEVVGVPEFNDLDSDGDLDVAAVLEWTGPDGWRGVYFWTWSNKKVQPVKWVGPWQRSCVVNDIRDADPITEVTSDGVDPGVFVDGNLGNYCKPDLPEDRYPDTSITRNDRIRLVQGVPAVENRDKYVWATHGCVRDSDAAAASSSEWDTVPENTRVNLEPSSTSPKVGSPTPPDTIRIWSGERTSESVIARRSGFVPVVLVWESENDDDSSDSDDLIGCGWVEWETVKGD